MMRRVGAEPRSPSIRKGPILHSINIYAYSAAGRERYSFIFLRDLRVGGRCGRDAAGSERYILIWLKVW